MTEEHDNALDIIRLNGDLKAIQDSLSRIEKQTTLTNGRVGVLEDWKNRAVGMWVGVSIFGPIVTGLVIGLVLGR